MAKRPCIECGALSNGTRCPGHAGAIQRSRWRERQRRRPTTAEAGYGSDHRRLRKVIAEQIERDGSVGCWRCGQAITAGMKWDLGHDDADRSIVRGAEHPRCNRATNTPGRATISRSAR